MGLESVTLSGRLRHGVTALVGLAVSWGVRMEGVFESAKQGGS